MTADNASKPDVAEPCGCRRVSGKATLCDEHTEAVAAYKKGLLETTHRHRRRLKLARRVAWAVAAAVTFAALVLLPLAYVSGQKPDTVPPPADGGGYADVGELHAAAVARLAPTGIFDHTDCEPTATRFCPGDPITRRDLATWLVHVMFGGNRTGTEHGDTAFAFAPTTYTDIPANVGWSADADLLGALNVATPCDTAGQRFCPDRTITRADAAAWVVNGTLGGETSPLADDAVFADLLGQPHAPAVNRLAEGGIVSGCVPSRFCPNDAITRGQAALVFARVLGLIPPVVSYNDGRCGGSWWQSWLPWC